MNASASALSRADEVQSKIRKVSAFSRGARVVCAAVFAFGLTGSVGMLLVGVLSVFNPALGGDSGLTPEQKLWALPLTGALMAAWLAVVYQLYRLFGNLAAGAIYTPENVHRLRQVGILSLIAAVLVTVLPVLWAALISAGLVEASDPPQTVFPFSWSESLSAFFTAGLILLVSWIMDVGLYEKDHAAELQRDADLVI